jgi:hypothetical protein
MEKIESNGIQQSKLMRSSSQKAKRTMAGMIAWSVGADNAARKHFFYYSNLANKVKAQQNAGQISPELLNTLQQSRMAAQQASLELAMAEAAVQAMRDGPAIFQSSILAAGCSETGLVSTKVTAGGSAHPEPSYFRYRVCPFRNATQLENRSGGSYQKTSVLGVWLKGRQTYTYSGPSNLAALVSFLRPMPDLPASEIVQLGLRAGVLPGKWSTRMDGLQTPISMLHDLRGQNESSYQLEEGQACNGSPRSTEFTFVCDDFSGGPSERLSREPRQLNDKLRILHVTENGKCNYSIVIGTPLRCSRQGIKLWRAAVQRFSAND